MEGCPGTGMGGRTTKVLSVDQIARRQASGGSLGLLVWKLAETAWNMWDHRNSVNNDRDTAMVSQELDAQIREEYAKGFQGFDNKALQLRSRLKTLLETQVAYKKTWLLNIRTVRESIATRRARRQPPRDVLEGEGYVAWMRKGGWNQL